MPYKHNQSRRHKIEKARYKVTNWPEYNKASRQRGDITPPPVAPKLQLRSLRRLVPDDAHIFAEETKDVVGDFLPLEGRWTLLLKPSLDASVRRIQMEEVDVAAGELGVQFLK